MFVCSSAGTLIGAPALHNKHWPEGQFLPPTDDGSAWASCRSAVLRSAAFPARLTIYLLPTTATKLSSPLVVEVVWSVLGHSPLAPFAVPLLRLSEFCALFFETHTWFVVRLTKAFFTTLRAYLEH